MKRAVGKIVLVVLLVYGMACKAYEIETHKTLSEAAASSSVLKTNNGVLGAIGLRLSIDDRNQVFPNSDGRTRNVLDLIKDGADFEDDDTRPVNHFFDPIRDTGLRFVVFLGNPSPDWALELSDAQTPLTLSDQDFSYRDIRDYFYRALTSLSEEERSRNFSRLFEGLGRVIHHVQDMAQPQHVRNDMHCDQVGCAFLGVFNPSLYEKFTENHRGELPFEAQPTLLNHPRDFWANTGGTGLAQFTNRNFVSAGSNFVMHNGQPSPGSRYSAPEPILTSDLPVDVQELFAEVGLPGPRDGAGNPLHGDVMFVGSRVDGALNRRASTLSLFDQDLARYNAVVVYPGVEIVTTERLFTLNRFNFYAAYPFLIPRAVAYSAGLINYFFRGRLGAEDVEFTDTGVRLRVKNAINVQETPAWKDETLYATNSTGARGAFVLAYDYKDASGIKQYGASSPIPAKTAAEGGGDIAPGNTSTAAYEFALSIPSGASEINYRLVFRGRLGQEEDAIAVGIAEPVSGFLVYPNYLPADGISGGRMIFKNAGTWMLSDRAGLVAAEIDWKGWYVNDRPTKVLSWRGPKSRSLPSNFAISFGPEIFQGGELFAIAPHRVLGAGLLKDVDGGEWLIAICHDGAGDIAYRRRATKSASPALFDPITEPDGWLEIGRLTDKTLLLADRPWFFNSSGTAAQTLRGAQKTGDEADILGTKLARLKATISIASVSFERADNLGPLVGRRSFVPEKSIEISTIGDFTISKAAGGRTYEYTETGEYIVAVDYKKDEAVECRVIVNNFERKNLRATVNASICRSNCDQYQVTASSEEDFTENDESHFSEKLRCGTAEMLINDDRRTIVTEARRTFPGPAFYEGTRVQVVADLDGSVAAVDLRHNMLASSTNSDVTSRVFSDVLTGGVVRGEVCGALFNSDGFATGFLRRRLDEVQLSGRTITVSDRTNIPLGEGAYSGSILIYRAGQLSQPEIDCFPFESNAKTETKRFPEIHANFVNGAWRIDGGENAIVSQESPGGTFNYISDGDLGQIIPPGGSAARYYPAFVIK